MPEIEIAAADGSGRSAPMSPCRRRKPAGAVVMIQEIFGVNATMRQLSDWVAEMGFIAISPDLFWRQEKGVQLDPDAGQAQWDKAFKLMQGMDQDKAVEDLKSTIAHARKMEGANGKVATMGFCLGGRLAFMTAARTDADANVSYYGVGIEGPAGRGRRHQGAADPAHRREGQIRPARGAGEDPGGAEGPRPGQRLCLSRASTTPSPAWAGMPGMPARRPSPMAARPSCWPRCSADRGGGGARRPHRRYPSR